MYRHTVARLPVVLLPVVHVEAAPFQMEKKASFWWPWPLSRPPGGSATKCACRLWVTKGSSAGLMIFFSLALPWERSGELGVITRFTLASWWRRCSVSE